MNFRSSLNEVQIEFQFNIQALSLVVFFALPYFKVFFTDTCQENFPIMFDHFKINFKNSKMC